MSGGAYPRHPASFASNAESCATCWPQSCGEPPYRVLCRRREPVTGGSTPIPTEATDTNAPSRESGETS